MRKFMALLLTVIFLTGCNDTMKDIKDAAAGINSKANEAATAISIDVHSIRAIELAFDNEQVTINDLFKTILRDVQWHYDESANILKITGTWKNNQLFSEQHFSEQQKQELVENGNVTDEILEEYADPESEKYERMVEEIRKELNFTSLRFNRLDDMLESTGVEPCKLCTYCWNGKE